MKLERRKYDPDFKRNAVRLSEEPGRTATEVAEHLGITKDLLYRWRREHRGREGHAFLGYGIHKGTGELWQEYKWTGR